MLKKIGIVALALSAVAVLAAWTSSSNGGGKDRLARMQKLVNWRVDDTLDDVDATDVQKKQVQVVTDKLFADAEPLIEGQDAARDQAIAQWNSPNPDSTKVHAIVDERIDAVRAFAHRVADGALELHKILTPDQRAKLGKQLQERSRR